MRYIYVAGPYSKGDPVLNTRAAIEAGEALIAKGYVPFVPHLSHLWHIASPHEIDYWYSLDIEWLMRCDAILRLPGESSGADTEVRIAEAADMPVFYSVDEL